MHADGLDADIRTLNTARAGQQDDANLCGPAGLTNPLARLIAPSLQVGKETLSPKQVKQTHQLNDLLRKRPHLRLMLHALAR